MYFQFLTIYLVVQATAAYSKRTFMWIMQLLAAKLAQQDLGAKLLYSTTHNLQKQH
jgi:hypothetical protein